MPTGSGTLTLGRLPIIFMNENESIKIPLGIPMEEAEKIIITENLAYFKGNKSKTADVLQIGRKTLHRKLEDMSLQNFANE